MSGDGTLDPNEATHRVVTRQPSGVKDWDETGRIAVENRVVDVLLRHGTAVHLSVAADAERLGSVTEQLSRVDGPDRLFVDGNPEYRASLPADADAVRSALTVDPGDTDAWVDRIHALHEFAVVTPDGWLYRSVPHHAHVRELNADGCGGDGRDAVDRDADGRDADGCDADGHDGNAVDRDGMLAAVVDELDAVPRSTVVPVDGLASWRSGGFRYELTWDALRRRDASDGGGDSVDAGNESDGGGGEGDGGGLGDDAGGRWTAFDLRRLRRVSPRPNRAELVVRWEPPSADSWPRRLVRRVLAPESVDPPTRLEFPDGEAMADAAEAFRELRADLDYGFAVEDP